MLDTLKRINWGLVAAVLYTASVWVVVIWILYRGLLVAR